MTTSNTTTYSINITECIETALQTIKVLDEGENLSDYDAEYAYKMLNLMLKNWQGDDLHLWVKQTATLFIQKNQLSYSLASTSTDHATINYYTTQTSAIALSGASSLTVDSTANMTAGDYIGVQLDNGYLFWSTIALVPDSTTVNLNDTLTDDVSVDAYVYNYTTKLDKPFNVYSAIRHSTSGTDTALTYLSYETYFQYPDKETAGIPVSYVYDRQRDDAVIKLYRKPDSTDNIVKLTISRRIQDVNIGTDNFDFPQEWELPIMLNLAVLCAPRYGKAKGENFTNLEKRAEAAFINASTFDNEPGSIYIRPETSNARGR